jgi:hypothetical protein
MRIICWKYANYMQVYLAQLVTTMWFSSTDVIDYDIFVGALLSEEMRKISSK